MDVDITSRTIRPFAWLERAFWNLHGYDWDDRLEAAETARFVEVLRALKVALLEPTLS